MFEIVNQKSSNALIQYNQFKEQKLKENEKMKLEENKGEPKKEEENKEIHQPKKGLSQLMEF